MSAFINQENRPLKKARLGYVVPEVYPQDKKQKEVGHCYYSNSSSIFNLHECCFKVDELHREFLYLHLFSLILYNVIKTFV